MAEMIWAKNPETGATARIPEEALPALAGSGWAKCTKAEVAEQDKRLKAEREERIASLTPEPPDAAATGPTTTTTTAPEPRPADTDKESA